MLGMVKEIDMRLFAVAVAGLSLLAGLPLSAQQQGPRWGYDGKTGPFNWSKLDPAYKACNSGKDQSPIDIRGAHLDKALQPVEFHYPAGPMTLKNTGHTVEVTPPAGSYIVVGGTRYDLVQFHFHHPGEEPVKGKLADMSLHLVHKSADGKLLVIAVRLNEGNPNAVLAALWAHLPKATGATDTVTESMSPAGLLPSDRAYWTYEGSLTAPPCTEGVRWIVYKQEVDLSRDQLRSFGFLYKVNSRMVQADHGRKIEASQ
jgi:carbonic anhydrase